MEKTDSPQSAAEYVDGEVKSFRSGMYAAVLDAGGGKALYLRTYEILKQRAKDDRPITYGEVAKAAAPPGRRPLDMANPHERNASAFILGALSDYEYHHGRPLLSVMVVHKDRNDDSMPMPGSGFFELAESHGLFDGSDREVFYCEETARTHDYWKAHH